MDAKIENPVRRAGRRYLVEFGVAMGAYVVEIVLSRWLLRGPMREAGRGWQVVVALLPAVPMVFVLAAVVRLVRATDELCRQIYLESLAIAGGATALVAVSYGLIEGDGFPRMSAWWTYVIFMTAWAVATPFVRRRYR